MNAQIFEALDGLESKLSALLSSLTTSPTAASAPAAAAALLEADDAVSSALDTLRTHQANYAKILRLRAEAESLEERIKSTVRDIAGIGKEIAVTTGDDDDDDDDASDTETDTESEDEDERDENLMTDGRGEQQGRRRHGRKKRKEVDYRLLLDFARRISKYNKQAAADAAAGVGARPIKKLQKDGDTEMTDVNGDAHATGPGPHEGPDEPVPSVTKEAAKWLDESADQARQVYMIPYPSEDRIRMGVMGQLQMAAAERQIDPEKEAERMVREAEGIALAGDIPEQIGPDQQLADEAARAAAEAGSTVMEGAPEPGGRVMRPAPAPKPRAKLDLDLYDPDDDDI
ncbi:hypothetical protein VTN96DRAFT_1168 [Rasamsonia emersonii]|uniref:Mediator of RNA polymerase II transcription subunit 4 n=1 Tax=Rasamsonia emersonii (strain ATCC 16479 / CBS 393.64 / IMI 116815) TaxID=1408163 RepID=A0A0F4YQ10_RASE3|nr:hypothetical protein T310_5824 [Rasamsonia emersonii CBS 393.64]KKA20170.1 hypothetical protein T310_5824 [Rasamsonia emersonii CBS 393.64]